MLSIIGANPFLSSFSQSDFFGKMIFLSLFLLSVLSWTILAYKIWITRLVEREGLHLRQQFASQRTNPLHFQPKVGSPFGALYQSLRSLALEILKKNHSISDQHYLSSADLEGIGYSAQAAVARETKRLEKNIFLLSMVTGLAPFLGLLGTVWGILLTFGELQSHQFGGSQTAVLGGLSMALGTTVLGLIVAIPALVGHSYLKAKLRELRIDMEQFCTDAIGAVELQYRRVEG
jgi:biopolymer transport protein TolQ